jgi:hypothetical protein
MNEIKNLIGEYNAVPMPNDADNVELHQEPGKSYLTYHTGMGTEDYDILREPLPPGEWELIGLSDQISEGEAEKIVERDYFDGIGYQYANYGVKRKWTFGNRYNSARNSLMSLLKSKGLNRAAIIKRKKQDI